MTLAFATPEDIGAAAWSRFVDDCEEAWIGHTRESLARLGDASRSFAVLEDGNVVAVFVASVANWNRIRVLSGPGPAISAGAVREDIVPAMRQRIETIARDDDISAMWLIHEPLAPGWHGRAYPDSVLPALGCSIGWPAGDSLRAQVGSHSVLDITKSPDDIARGFSSSHRRALSRARKVHVEAAAMETGDVGAWTAFRAIMRETLMNNGLADYSDAYYRYLRSLCAAKKGSLYIAHLNGQPASCLLVQSYKQGAHYLVGGGTADGYENGAFVKLHLAAMSDLSRREYKFYDLGATYPGLTGTKMGNIGVFKSRFGGEKWAEISGHRVFDRRRYFFGALLVQVHNKSIVFMLEKISALARWIGLRKERNEGMAKHGV